MLRNRLAILKAFRRIRLISPPWLTAAALLLGAFLPLPAHSQVVQPTVNIAVRVADEEQETPIDRAKVEVLVFPEGILQVAFTDGSGRVEFYRLLVNRYIIRASKEGYRTAEVTVDLRRGEYSRDVRVGLQRIRAEGMSPVAGVVSARMLSVPQPALKQFQKGLEVLNEKKDPKRSIEYFQKAIEISPDYSEAQFMLGMAYLQLKSYNEAQAALTNSIELNPKFIKPYYPLAVLLISQKQYDAAEQTLLQAMELDKQDWKWPFELARCHAGRGQWEKALTYGLKAHGLPNPPSKVHLLMADLYSNTGNSAKAVEELEEFSKIDPQSPYMPRVQQVLSQLRKPGGMK